MFKFGATSVIDTRNAAVWHQTNSTTFRITFADGTWIDKTDPGGVWANIYAAAA